MKLRPINDVLICVRAKKPETASKLILTCNYEERSMLEVVASSCDEQGLSVGCTIVVPTHIGMPIKFDNVDYIVVKKSDVLAYVERD